MSANKTWRELASTSKWLEDKKSKPRMGESTEARRNSWENRWDPNWRGTERVPQERMERPSAPTNLGPKGGAEEWQGRTLRAAPVSTR